MLTNLKQNLMKLLISKQKILRDLVLKKMWTDLKGKITTDFFLYRSNSKKKEDKGRYVPAKGATYPRRALRTREGRYVPAKGATYPRRALRTREERYIPTKGATYPRRALRTREGRYVPANGAISSKK